jgi:transcriptional regulator with XRE-family HTH domain
MPIEKPASPGEGENFRRFRKAMGWSIVELAQILEKSEKTIMRYEHGLTPIPASVWLACNYLALESMNETDARQSLYRFRRIHALKGFPG